MSSQNSIATELQRLQDIILDEEASFSGTEMVSNLEALLGQVDQPQGPIAGQILNLLSLVQNKRGDTDEVLKHGEACVTIDQRTPFLNDESRFYLHYRLSCALEEDDQPERAMMYLNLVLQNPVAVTLDDDQHRTLVESLARLLHEAAHFEEALALNTNLLDQAETAGETNLRVLNNLAQNCYELGRLEDAESYLRQRLAAAQAADEEGFEDAFDSLFQLGVLSFESGNPEQARQLFEQRLALARNHGDEFDVSEAEETLAELAERS
ncbi:MULTISPECIES: tetratricopeptide repeat protein [Marinobacter]|uniref:tetratricopeptide repeat protein n=1 Tax=Marinobacter TaxID=2742 RepID=UPI001D08069F|nr:MULTISPECIES: tetratricopeptide repeat protein [Marinobacter]MCG8517779.1 tetratricopeptide repeat protein [Pseudomonadales bacterium]MCK7565535.1 tetratricopeptide repeat protein [Marinobacter xestospongiae]UDL06320.1 tetratricopeptide repeat protein [Marinobacter sp. CA1]